MTSSARDKRQCGNEIADSASACQRNIGIMTFHWAHNYGAVLQAYALCAHIRNKLGFNVSIIDFRTARHEQLNRIFRRLRFDRNIIKALVLYSLRLFHIKALRNRSKRFKRFGEFFFSRTRRYKDYAELKADPPVFDAVISGSDQVFNANILPADELSAYCLAPFDAPNTRRIAYAPSFGAVGMSDQVKNLISEPLRKFDHLSSREAEGQSLLQEIVGTEVPQVLDPVFLINRAAWREIALPDKRISKPYILCYALNGKEALGAIACKVKQILDIPVVLVTSNIHNRIKADIRILDAGPREFVWLLDNADFVITDSFHGTAFSVHFQKDFFTHIALPKYSQRILGLLHNLGLSDRVVKDASEITDQTRLHLDYSHCDVEMSRQTAVSESYLSKALSLPCAGL